MSSDLSDLGLLLVVLAFWAGRETIHQWWHRQNARVRRVLGIHRSFNSRDWNSR